MMKRWNSFVRKATPLLSAGLLLQANGCSINIEGITQGVVTAIVNDLITSFLFSVFSTGSF